VRDWLQAHGHPLPARRGFWRVSTLRDLPLQPPLHRRDRDQPQEQGRRGRARGPRPTASSRPRTGRWSRRNCGRWPRPCARKRRWSRPTA
jgi:hypothetical protein